MRNAARDVASLRTPVAVCRGCVFALLHSDDNDCDNHNKPQNSDLSISPSLSGSRIHWKVRFGSDCTAWRVISERNFRMDGHRLLPGPECSLAGWFVGIACSSCTAGAQQSQLFQSIRCNVSCRIIATLRKPPVPPPMVATKPRQSGPSYQDRRAFEPLILMNPIGHYTWLLSFFF